MGEIGAKVSSLLLSLGAVIIKFFRTRRITQSMS